MTIIIGIIYRFGNCFTVIITLAAKIRITMRTTYRMNRFICLKIFNLDNSSLARMFKIPEIVKR